VIDHVVLFKLKPDAPAGSGETLVKQLTALRGRIPGVIDISCGKTFTARAKGFDYGLFVRLSSRAALDTYLLHPLHVAAVNAAVKPVVEEIIALDWTEETSRPSPE